MKQMIIGKFGSNQGVSKNPFLAVVHWPCSMEQKRDQLGFQVRIFNVFGIGQKCDAQSNNLFADSGDHDIWDESVAPSDMIKAIFTCEYSYRKIKLKFPTISSRAYSGRNLKASSCSAGNGNLNKH